MPVRRRASVLGLVAAAVALGPFGAPAARAQVPDCARAVVVTVTGITWADVARLRPPEILAAVADGAVGSMSVRTVGSHTSFASGFATIGAGNRLEGGRTTGGPADVESGADLFRTVEVGGLAELELLAEEDRYGAVPGALGGALRAASRSVPIAIGNADPGRPPPAPAGFGRWSLLAAMDDRGIVERAATGPELLIEDPAAPFGVRTDPRRIGAAVDSALGRCGATVVIDPGDLARAERLRAIQGSPASEELSSALAAADALIGRVRTALSGDDLLLIVSPTSPMWDRSTHFGIAVAVGPDIAPGRSLASASTRRAGIVTLPDIAPTILDHFGVARPATMQGRPMYDVDASTSDRIGAAIELDREAVFVDRVRTPVVTSFVVLQVVVYLLTIWLLARRERRGSRPAPNRWLERSPELVALALIAFPVTTYLAGVVSAHDLGFVWFPALLGALDLAIVAATVALVPRPLDRLLVVTALTTLVIVIDLMTGSRLQLNTVFSYSPLVAGRFAGLGNIGFSVLAITTLIAGALIAHRWSGSRMALGSIALLFLVVVVVDGAPQYGSDVGGILALVPGLGITWFLLAGRRPNVKLAAASVVAALAFLAAFLVVDLRGPVGDRTHLARLYEDVRSGGWSVFGDAIVRKVRTNLRVFRSTIWTYLVPPLVGAMAWLLLRPRGRWKVVASAYPRLHAGLVGALVLAALGFAVNDSGIVIPAVILSYLVPMAVVMHTSLELGTER
ncbi:MAG: hypothetical protein ABR575_08810 [Actinomycetota bacterium]